ncbi:MAG TPA: DUF1566 domain-containing protein [Epsilonproteobacteria bacterium]|nr:DUF1566 domain-containing protein [Campylobacterota bacterium]
MRFVMILIMLMSFLSAEEKIALLMGNDDYRFQPLDNPLNDVDGIYNTLIKIGFKKQNITVLKNRSQEQMKKALFDFEQQASSAEIALIYFSGHGMQVNNTNYMFPARTTATKPIHLEGLVNLNMFVQSASSAKYGIVLVDACRNNPLIQYFQEGKHKGSTAKKGLGQVTPKSGQVVIGFATQAGETADDGSGSMSPYAAALSQRLKEPNKDITKVLGLVALDVSSRYNQNPMIRTNLAYDVCLYGACGTSQVKIIEKEKIVYVKPEVTQETRRVDSSINNTQWITPTNSTCQANGGKLYKGVCQATWADAQKICRASGGRLPSREDLHKVIRACGGIVDEWNKNINNSRYQSCYKEKGFSNNYSYWTRETYKEDSSYAWDVHLHLGFGTWYNKSGKYYALCIRGQ